MTKSDVANGLRDMLVSYGRAELNEDAEDDDVIKLFNECAGCGEVYVSIEDFPAVLFLARSAVHFIKLMIAIHQVSGSDRDGCETENDE